MKRADRERKLRAENQRMKAALSAIHDRLHADDVNAAHEMCESALCGGAVTQPNLTASAGARTMDFAAAFNALADAHRAAAACIMFVPSATVPGATSIQICGHVDSCKTVERMLRGDQSVYMGDHR